MSRKTPVRDLFSGYLGSRKLKMTRGRQSILEAIESTEGHFGADELHMALRGRGARVSRATVYRALEHLVGSGLVERVYVGENQQRRALYEHVHGRRHHEHMHCIRCGRIIEFVDDQLEERQEQVCRRMEFKPLRHALRIDGICRSCQDGP